MEKEEKKEKTIYDLKLHETMDVEELSQHFEVMRVPGGWFYLYYNNGPQVIFVEYNKDLGTNPFEYSVK